MSQYLFTVSDVFVVKGRGIVLAPGFLFDQILPEYPIKIGTKVELRFADGRVIQSEIRGWEGPPNTLSDQVEAFFKWRDQPKPILVPLLLSKEDVPIGTEVWLES